MNGSDGSEVFLIGIIDLLDGIGEIGGSISCIFQFEKQKLFTKAFVEIQCRSLICDFL